MINFELDWGLIIVLSVSIALLVIAVVWAIWLCKYYQVMPELRSIVKAIVKYLKR